MYLPIVCEVETVPSTALRTLILEDNLSTLRTLTLSVPAEIISFSLILSEERSPTKLKNVTSPVTPSVPIATPVVPTPAMVNLLVDTPAR